jgi:AcrR family transcriptional regulator
VSARPSSPTRERIIAATLETLRQEGFAGTSARAIGRRGGFNQALIYYHFGSIKDLFMAALDHASGQRLARYREALESVGSLSGLVETMGQLYREDVQSGLVTTLQEIFAGSSSAPELGPLIVERMAPWVALGEELMGRLLKGSPLKEMLPRRDLAFAFVALYLGMETVTRLDGDRSKADALFAIGARLAPLMDALLGTLSPGSG